MNNKSKYTTLLEELSRDHTIPKQDRLAFKQLYGFSIINTKDLLNNAQQLKEVYNLHGFGTIFSSNKNNNTARKTGLDFITIIYEIQEFINFIIENKESKNNIPQILKNNINNISNNTEKPYKTGILDFIKKCRFDINNNNDELDAKMLLYFTNYNKDFHISPLGNFIKENFQEEYKYYTTNTQSIEKLLNTVLNKNIKTNQQIFQKILDFLYNYFLERLDMDVDKFIKTCIKLFPNNSDEIKIIKDNILKEKIDNALSETCTLEKAKFTTCEPPDLVPKYPEYPGFYLCNFPNSIEEFNETFCNKIAKKGGYTKLKKKVKLTYNNKIYKTYKKKNYKKTHKHIKKYM